MLCWILSFSVWIIISTSKVSGSCILVESVPNSLCIPLEVINDAFVAARHTVGLHEPYHGPFLNQHQLDQVDKLGLVITETTRILADKYNLNHHQIFYFLPKLDLSLTEIWKFCPDDFQHKICEQSKYRSLSGHCNNIWHTDWGATFAPFQNFLPPHHPDGVSEPRGYEHGYLPSPRVVSSIMHRDAVVHDHALTVMLIAWGQIIDHDITLTADTKDPYTLKDPECCGKGSHHQHHNCFPIKLPRNDPFYSHYGQDCMNFARSLAGVRSDCRLGPRKAFNKISSFLDASFVYGSDYVLGSKLRTGENGLLQFLPIFEHLNLKALLPLKMEEPDDGCIRHDPDVFCFLAGDIRVNEQLVLTVLHTIFMREHNRIARILGGLNPHWDDERIFQETRRIIIAITQHITYNEFLPLILGKHLMHDYRLTLEDENYWGGYDPTIDPTAAEEFVTSAFRFGHSLLPQKIERWSHSHRFIESQDLHRLIRQPYDVYRPGYIDTFIMGMVNQLAQSMDEGVTEQVTTLLFKEPHVPFGMDLAAMNIQRGREHGVPGYTTYREICGLSPISSWTDLHGVMKNETIHRYRSIYKSPHDIDLWSGGVSEIPERSSLLGPTFGCIIARQFHALRFGDRFWYELPDLASSFTPHQLQEIRKVRLSRLLCDNGDDLKTVQIYAMVLPDNHLNPRVPCHSQIIPRINLEKWREIPGVTDIGNLHNENDNYLQPPPPLPSPLPHLAMEPPSQDFATFEYQHEHDIQEGSYGQEFGYGPSSSGISISDIEFTTPEPPKSSSVAKIFHKIPPPAAKKIVLPQSPPSNAYGYGYDDYLPRNAPEIHYDHNSTTNNPHSHNHYDYRSNNGRHQHVNNVNHASAFAPALFDPHLDGYADDADKGEDGPRPWIQPPRRPIPLSQSGSDSVGINSYLTMTVPAKIPKVKIITKRPPPKSRKFQPFPNSPIPGWSGIFSPNPGYLVRQNFEVYKAPAYTPPIKGWKGMIG